MRNFILFTIALLSQYFSYSQCIPDTTLKKPGVYPKNLPNGYVGTLYNQSIQFKFPKDTVTLAGAGYFDSIRITKIQNLPSSYSYKCNNDSCFYRGGANGCITLTGMPVQGDSGIHKIVVTVNGRLIVPGVINAPVQKVDTIPLLVTTGSAIRKIKTPLSQIYTNSLQDNFPNPFTKSTEIKYTSSTNQQAVFKAYDILGNLVVEKSFNAKKGENSLLVERGELKSGFYFYSLQLGANLFTKRFIIKD